jgi:large subunit ribosomal protein L18
MGAVNGSFVRRSRRVRHSLKRAANGRARLSVFRSSRHIYAQVIDDNAGKTVAAASTLRRKPSASCWPRGR